MRVNDGRRSVNDRRRSVMMGGMKNVMMGGRKNVKIGRTSMGVPRSKCGGWKENMYVSVREGGVMEHERGVIAGIGGKRNVQFFMYCTVYMFNVHVQKSCTCTIVHCALFMCNVHVYILYMFVYIFISFICRSACLCSSCELYDKR